MRLSRRIHLLALIALFAPAQSSCTYDAQQRASDGARKAGDYMIENCHAEGCVIGILLLPAYFGIGALSGLSSDQSKDNWFSQEDISVPIGLPPAAPPKNQNHFSRHDLTAEQRDLPVNIYRQTDPYINPKSLYLEYP